MAAGVPVDSESSESSSGYEDGLGRRVLAFDRETGGMLERLVLRPELSAFEQALRDRIGIVAGLEDERFTTPRAIERDADNRLTVVSECVAGRRLADLLDSAGEHGIVAGLDAALGLLLELLPALSRLHDAGLAHGALAPGRVMVTPAGQIVFLDSIYGDVLERLKLTRRRLWSEFRLAFPPTAGVARFDKAADLSHAIMVAAALTVGRPLKDEDYPEGLAALRTEILEIASIRGSKSFAESVDRFFSSYLPISPRRTPPSSADEAAIDLRKLVRKELGITVCRNALLEFFQQIDAADGERAAAEAAEREARARAAAERAAQMEVQGRLDAERIERERVEQAGVEAERIERERIEAERRERERLEAERRDRERLEAERRERERLEAQQRERERLDAERREQERIEAERRERERLEAEHRERERLEAERLEAERRERERLEAERHERERLEVERRERERLEAEQSERERLEAERLEAERRERERLEAERRERERLEAERRERERLERLEAERRERERLEAERRERERLEAERRERERLEAERLEAERRERERLEAERRERERLEAERREAERRERERLEAERKERERLEAERLERERAEKARLEAERRERERLEAEKRERERLEAEKRERERQEAERRERERLEAERLERERVEKARLEAERKERERLEAERAEKARLEAERKERERLEAERLERERVEKARLEAERKERERLEAERAEKARLEAERKERERQEAERKERERVEKARLEAERKERERQEAERKERERQEAERAEKARLEAERKDRERQEAERLERERAEKARLEAERKERERQEAERIERERAEKARLEAEQKERERQEADRRERERQETERRERERQEAERRERERREREEQNAFAAAAPPPPASNGWLIPPDRAAAFEPTVQEPQRPAPTPRAYPVYHPPSEPGAWNADIPPPPQTIQIAPVAAAPPPSPVPFPSPAAQVGPAPIRLKDDVPVRQASPTRERRYEPDLLSGPTTYVEPADERRQMPWKMIAAAVLVIVGTIAVTKGGFLGPGTGGPNRPTPRSVPTPQNDSPPPPPTLSPKMGRVTIESDPDGARVLMDGKPAGQTPLTLESVPPGRRTFTIITAGGTVKRTLKVEAGKSADINVAISSGMVAVSAPIELEVSENGKSLGVSGQPIILSSGHHELRLANRELGYAVTQPVEVQGGGQETRVNIDPRGTANINASPWAEVFVDGEKVGETPIANMKIRLGVRDIVFRNPQFPDKKVTITVKATEAASVTIDFNK